MNRLTGKVKLTKTEERKFNKVLDNDDYSQITGVNLDHVEYTLATFPSPKFCYRNLDESEKDEIILAVQKKLTQTGLPLSGINDPLRWEKGWGEILEKVKNDKISLEILRPQYFQHNTLRFRGNYIKVSEGSMEHVFFSTISRILFQRYLKGCQKIIEFGCGTGTNLVILHELFPKAKLIGCDWASPSQEILKIIATELKAKIGGTRFNMLTLEGRENLTIDSGTAIITMHAMEQLGMSFNSLLEYFLENKPQIVFHIEPIFELYKPNQLFDKLAIKYHEKRNYLKGYLPTLKKLEGKGKIEILEVRRFFFGGLFHEPYSLVAWKVK